VRLAEPSERKPDFMIEDILILVLCLALLAYLVYAMLRPEKF
jgi:K+-transporting ATPase KdpF subunit